MTRITLLVEENCASFALAGFQDAFATANFMWAFMGHAEPIFHLRTVTLDGRPASPYNPLG